MKYSVIFGAISVALCYRPLKCYANQSPKWPLLAGFTFVVPFDAIIDVRGIACVLDGFLLLGTIVCHFIAAVCHWAAECHPVPLRSGQCYIFLYSTQKVLRDSIFWGLHPRYSAHMCTTELHCNQWIPPSHISIHMKSNKTTPWLHYTLCQTSCVCIAHKDAMDTLQIHVPVHQSATRLTSRDVSFSTMGPLLHSLHLEKKTFSNPNLVWLTYRIHGNNVTRKQGL